MQTVRELSTFIKYASHYVLVTDNQRNAVAFYNQVSIMKEHEFLVGETGKYLFHKNGSTIYVECSDGWVVIEPKLFKNMN